MSNKKPFSFWDFLRTHDIEIPIIQRDYAQGRRGEEDLRKKFLIDLRDALDGKLDGGKVLKLDFVYGAEDKGVVYPLDGQQRLTTLWLLHWYIAYKAEKIYEAKDVLKKFAYKTRKCSQKFCEKLSIFSTEDSNGNGRSIAKWIANQQWFREGWEQDPTIQSMLNMLSGTRGDDGIENVFRGANYEGYWEKLTNTNNDAPIVFYYLPLEDFGFSDDLYIKMNARGKPLTDLENFKADLITYLRKEEDNDLYKNISNRLDTTWTDIFWKNKSDKNKIDEIYFAFLNRFFWNELFVGKKAEEDLICFEEGSEEGSEDGSEDGASEELEEDLKGSEEESEEGKRQKSLKHFSKDYLSGYSSMDLYKFLDGKIPTTLFKRLQVVLDKYKAYMDVYNKLKEKRENPLSDLVSKDKWDSIPFPDIFFPKWIREDFAFIPKYKVEKGYEISRLEPPSRRVMFYALCKYFTEEKATEEPPTETSFVALKQWMRVVCNLVSGRDTWGHTLIRHYSKAKSVIKDIEKLDSHSILKNLCYKQRPFENASSDFQRRWNEEIIKAKQILSEDGKTPRKYNGTLLKEREGSKEKEEYKTWEEIIIDAEEYAFFNGAIRFLYQNENGEVDWGNFDTKLKNAKDYFKRDVKEEDTGGNYSPCVKNDDEMKLLKALISKLDAKQFLATLFHSHRTFNNGPSSWRYYLLNSHLCAPIHELLLGHKDIENPLERPGASKEKTIIQYDKKKIEARIAYDILYLLSHTKLLNYIAEKIPSAWIRDGYHDGHYAIYRKKSPGGVLLDMPRRDAFFKNRATNKVTIDENIIVSGDEKRDLLRGVDIRFEYSNGNGKKARFEWYHQGDYIYLLYDSGSKGDDPYVYRENPSGSKEEEDVYYCFSAKDLKKDEEIIAKLGEILEEGWGKLEEKRKNQSQGN